MSEPRGSAIPTSAINLTLAFLRVPLQLLPPTPSPQCGVAWSASRRSMLRADWDTFGFVGVQIGAHFSDMPTLGRHPMTRPMTQDSRYDSRYDPAPQACRRPPPTAAWRWPARRSARMAPTLRKRSSSRRRDSRSSRCLTILTAVRSQLHHWVWTISHGFLSPVPPLTRRAMYSTECSCLWDTDWLQSDAMTNSGSS